MVNEGESGFIVEDVDSAAEAVEKAINLNRRKCRQIFERRFTVTRMACDYLKAFGRLHNGKAEESADPGENDPWMISCALRIVTTFYRRRRWRTTAYGC